jgi:hypothetical protein
MSLSWTLGFAFLMLAVLLAVGLGVWVLHHVNAERDRRERAQGIAPEAARSVWTAAGRWLARH